ncbi:hypothetical protein EUGRSUZ_C00650 [Eucalyptus grandis]|uniref:Uncharacterized protein n=2 Tax=Eucalyptus grandis TaxID=71139 RepID=A0ACC3LAH2_EUCGR|nr:hypothetical protein EUGRSUZ_C00650 [Eucalyptus grandis]
MMDLELHMLDGFFGDLPEASDIIGACSSTNALSSSPDSGLSWFIENILMKDNEDGRVAGGGIRADSSQEFCDRFLADVLVDSPGDGSAEIADGSGDKEEPGSSSDGWVEAAKVDGANVGGEAYDPASKKLRRYVGSLKPEKAISDAILRQAKRPCNYYCCESWYDGTGLVVARREDGSWSPPSTISSCGIGWGAKVNELKKAMGPLSGRSLKYCDDACLRRYLEA